MEGTFDTKVRKESILREKGGKENKEKFLVEIGPRLNISTAFSTNAVSICEASGITKKVQRIERSTLYFISLQVSYVVWESFQSDAFKDVRKGEREGEVIKLLGISEERKCN